ncbi:lipid asymmetry maintenance protein MlaB [Providencia sp. PROV188]|jgi:phospholipid transport system transporter-binding protein|uniref:lipid asymmetry maintenance protein MlaB n=1 Tax=Providencia TaxID=586 RepID=UPI0003E2537A|nr:MULTISPECIES: lipid asymmetry maintenance protein MlaB [Providencia]ETS98474.1 STAS domain protein [Providencia alcalifaciens PAL-3]EUC97796.1 STAS domain protein [Providencia alcalifaciens PAL-1]MBG5883258.1 lipid asymmetry maintenance protein MlaB [Providencia alcalifaciens]MBS0923073.1 lipid asymmetry maintenance protein MlaB [Providencia sp. JGM181]MBS0934366.1 lipid asymmetry maintenance protein MlaB [Providencia sp. JGM172]
MSSLLSWTKNNKTLAFSGILNRDSLVEFWDKRQTLLTQVEQVDVSALTHVDSTGLAMLVRLKGEYQSQQSHLGIVGVSDNLNTLMELYGVKSLLMD